MIFVRTLGLCRGHVYVCVCVFLLLLPVCETFTSHLSQSDLKKGVFSGDCLLFSRFSRSEVIRNLCESIRSHGCIGWAQAGPLPLLHPYHAVCGFYTILSREYGQAYRPSSAEPISLTSQKCLLPAGGHKRRTGEKASEPRQSQLLQGNMALTTSCLHYAYRRKQSGWLFVSPVRRSLVNSPP